MVERFVVRVVLAGDGERIPMVVDGVTCLPDPHATVFATSLSRPASGSHSTMEQELRGVAGLLNFLAARSIDLPSRVALGRFLSAQELDGLVSHFGRFRRNTALGGNAASPGERTVVLRMNAARRFLEHRIDLLSHDLWPTLEARDAGRMAVAGFMAGIAARVPTPRPKDTSRRALTKGQETALVAALLAMARKAERSDSLASFFAADRTLLWFDWSVEFGLRTGEMLGLRLRDLDLEAGTFRVVRRPDAADDPRRELARVKGEGRELQLSPYLAARTREHVASMRATLPGAARHDFLFVASNGAPLSRSAVNKMFVTLRRVCPVLGEDFCNHVMRHTWNERFGGDAVSAGLTDEEEMTARAYAQGWRDPSSAVAYLAHRTRRRAAEISRLSQERMMAAKDAALE